MDEFDRCGLYRALNLEPPNLKKMKQMAQQRAHPDGRILHAKPSAFRKDMPVGKEEQGPKKSAEAEALIH